MVKPEASETSEEEDLLRRPKELQLPNLTTRSHAAFGMRSSKKPFHERMKESIDPKHEAKLARLGNSLISTTLAKKDKLKIKGTKGAAPKMNETKKRVKKPKQDIAQMSYTHPNPPKFSKLLEKVPEKFTKQNKVFKNKLKRQ